MELPDEETCGFSYDHNLRLIDERDGMRTYECSECGAEIVEDDAGQSATDQTRETEGP